MKMKLIVCALAATAAIAASAAFEEPERNAVRKSVNAVETMLKSDKTLNGKAITVLPVRGDAEEYCERLLIGALVNAKKTCVVPNDEQDARFKRILETIKWDERQTTLKSIDPKTADELGRLLSTQIFIEARLELFRRGRKRRAVAELNLLAYEVSTKQYVWTANIALDESGRGWPDASEYNVKIDFKGEGDAAGVAAIAASVARNVVAGYGYRVNADGPVDLALTASFTRDTFDRSNSYLVFTGAANVRLASCVGDGVLYEQPFTGKGKRGLGETEAERNLATDLDEELVKWLDDTLKPAVFFAKHRDFAAAAGN